MELRYSIQFRYLVSLVKSKKCGTKYEREAAEILRSQGFLVHRIAGSGSDSKAICDLIAIDPKLGTYLIEVKSTVQELFYLSEHKEQFNELLKASSEYGFTPLIMVKFKGKRVNAWQTRKLTQDLTKISYGEKQ